MRLLVAVGCWLCLVGIVWSQEQTSNVPAPNAIQTGLLKTFNSEFIAIKPGSATHPQSFVMGSDDGPANERPAHEVKLTHEFSMAKYEIPQNLYAAVMGSNPSRWKGPRNSVEMFSFEDAVEFCRRATSMMRAAQLIGDDEEIRLPTEAEWEYCCRAGTKTRYSFGNDAQAAGDTDKKATLLNAYGWHTGNAAGNDPPVGALKPNGFGLYDTHGYLWEFVADDWQETYSETPTDGSAYRRKDSEPAKKVIRGGSWKERFDRLTSTARQPISADYKSEDLGLRCVKARGKK